METCFFVSGVKPSDCAAWIQAFGSILAIVASGLIAAVQIRASNRSEQRAQRERKRAMTEAAAALARQFTMQVTSLQAELKASAFYLPGVSRSAAFDPFSALKADVLSLPLHEMPDISGMRLLIGFRNLVNTTDTAFKRLAIELETPERAALVSAASVEHLVLAAAENERKWGELVGALHPLGDAALKLALDRTLALLVRMLAASARKN